MNLIDVTRFGAPGQVFIDNDSGREIECWCFWSWDDDDGVWA